MGKKDWVLRGSVIVNGKVQENDNADFGGLEPEYYYEQLKKKFERKVIVDKKRLTKRDRLKVKTYKNFDRKNWDSFLLDLSDFIDDINTLDLQKEQDYLKIVLQQDLQRLFYKYLSKDAKDKIHQRKKYQEWKDKEEKNRDKKYEWTQDLTNENRNDTSSFVEDNKENKDKKLQLDIEDLIAEKENKGLMEHFRNLANTK